MANVAAIENVSSSTVATLKKELRGAYSPPRKRSSPNIAPGFFSRCAWLMTEISRGLKDQGLLCQGENSRVDVRVRRRRTTGARCELTAVLSAMSSSFSTT